VTKLNLATDYKITVDYDVDTTLSRWLNLTYEYVLADASDLPTFQSRQTHNSSVIYHAGQGPNYNRNKTSPSLCT